MSLRLEMLQVARLAPAVLGDAVALVRDYVHSRQRPDGGFADREGNSDLYYTVFAVDALTALQAELPLDSLRSYLDSFGHGEGLDFVHRCCLARAWSALPAKLRPDREALLSPIEDYRSGDGGYAQSPGAGTGTAYAALLAYGAHADHGVRPPRLAALAESLAALATPDGGFSNDRGRPQGLATATAAAVTLLRNLRRPVPPGVPAFLLSCAHPQGGFAAFPGAPMPDLLSTAVTLHALDGLQAGFDALKEPCLDFIDSLWTADGGFHGTWADDVLDLEYTYYGLLALGHLSL